MKRALHLVYRNTFFFIMLRIFLTAFFVFFISLVSYSATITSNQDGDWGNSNTWGGSIPTASDDVVISDIVTIQNGASYEVNSVNISNSSNLIVYGSLVINGDLTMENLGDFEMHDNSLVIVKGNVTLGNKTVISLSSTFIVLGDFTGSGAAGQGEISINNAKVYILGTVTTPYSYFSVCDTYDGETTSETTESCDGGNFDALINNETGNPDIADIVQEAITSNTTYVTNLSSLAGCFFHGESETLTIDESNTIDLLKWYNESGLIQTVDPPSSPYTYSVSEEGVFYALYKIGSDWYQTNTEAITVCEDTTPPDISICLPDGSVNCVADVPDINDIEDFFLAGGEVSDNVTADNDLSLSYEDAVDPNAGCKVIRTYTISDEAGNEATCVQEFIVNDSEVPVINSLTDVYSVPNDNSCGANLTIPEPAAMSENCSLVDEGAYYEYSIGGTPYSGYGDVTALFPEGTTTITWTISDLCGNVSDPVTQNVHVGINLTEISYDNGGSASGIGSGLQPMQTSTHQYEVDGGTAETGFSYAWTLYESDGITPVNSVNYSISYTTQADLHITFESTLITGNYILEVVKDNTYCSKSETLAISVVSNSNFDVVIDDLGDYCQTAGGLTTISWDITFPSVESQPFEFSYSITVGGTTASTGSVSNITFGDPITETIPPTGSYASKPGDSWVVTLYYIFPEVIGDDLARTIEVEINATDAYEVSEPDITNNTDDLKALEVPVISFD